MNWYKVPDYMIDVLFFFVISAPATPTHVQIQSISTSSVSLKVTLPVGKYEGVTVKVYTIGGSSSVSSATTTVSLYIGSSEAEKDITVNGLWRILTPGVQYTVSVSTSSGTKTSSFSGRSNSATVGELNADLRPD